MAVSKDEILAKLKQKKRTLKASFTRMENFFVLINPNNFDIDDIKVRLEKAEETSKTLTEVLMEISSLDDTLSEIELDKELEELENRFFHLKLIEGKLIKGRVELAEGNENLAQAFPDATIHGNHEQRGTRGYDNFIRLPKIELPNFSGLYEEWYVFYDVFNSLIHSNHSLNDVQRFHYLKSALKGEAAVSISSLEISGINYTNAWARLKERYDNQRLIIQTHINAIFDLPAVRKENGTVIRQVLDGVLKHTWALQALKRPTQQWDDLLIHIVTSKLDIATIKEWENSLEPTVMPSFQELVTFLTKRCQTLEAVANQQQQFHVSTNSRKAGCNKVTTAYATATNFKCTYCKGEHQIYQCKTFQGLSVAERTNQVRLKGLCLNCLRSKHLAKDCIAGNCKICGKKHNSLLHSEGNKDKENKDKQLNQKQEQVLNENKKNSDSSLCHYTNLEEYVTPKQVLLSTAVLRVRAKNGQIVEGRALLDNGSQSNFIAEKFMSKLGLECSKTRIQINGINQQVSRVLKSVDLNVTSRFDSFTTDLKCVVLPCITQILPAIKINVSELDIPSSVRLADPKFHVPKEVDLLIGAEKFWDLICVRQIKLGKNKPTLQKTTLGWIIAGPMKGYSDNNLQTSCHLSREENLCDTVNKFWQVEDCISREKLTEEDRYVEELFKGNHSRDAEGRFVVKLPVNQKVLDQLGNSKDTAMKRLLSIERKFKKSPELRAEYVSFIKEYLELGHMRLVTEPKLDTKRVFLPHQAVIKENAVTTKTRVVFDASSKDSKGFSLNDALYKGPVIQSDLFTIVMRFRCLKYVICADIKKMYRQIKVHKDQTPLQTILWRKDYDAPVQMFELLTVTYGTKPASFLAVRCLHQLAEIAKKEFPVASEAILNDFYMDDILTGSDTVRGLKELKMQITELLSRGGFELHKWKSNVLSDVDERIGAESSSVDFCKDQESKLLGILWDANKDVLHYKSPIIKLENKVTKRVILSEVSRLFDPLGLVGSIITAAKILIQSLWACNIGWDDSVPMGIHKSWCQIKSQLHLLEFIEVPRLIISENLSAEVQLHGFCDASEQAYGACIYIRENNASTALLCSKSRVAPLKTLSLPRLELCGAVLLMKLMNKVAANLNVIVYKRCYWTDSKIVLAWLDSPARRWSTFVSNRIGKIQNSSSPSEWHHVKSKENPADLISRGVTPEKLKASEIWWKGPQWLSLNESEWPSEGGELSCKTIPEERVEILSAGILIRESIIPYNRYSSLGRLLRVVAWILRFNYNARCDTKDRRIGRVSALEINEARVTLIKTVQVEDFRDEINLLKCKGNVPKSSKLISLNPYIDNSEILRVGGRLKNSQLPEETKHPIILPSAHPVTKLIIRDKHEKLFHAGAQATLASVREEYWPLAARSQVKGIIRKCVRCVKASPTPCHQIMGQLPAARVVPVRPFYNTGVDYCGPFLIRDRVRRNSKQYKTYVAVFVCMVTKAVHLELVEDVTSAAFIGALKRFISRRGKVVNMYSDNGTNFQGADNELKDLFENAEFKTDLQEAMTEERLTWHFIPPRAPHFGGLWEAAVRSMKQHLKRTVGDASLTIVEMMTVLAQIEVILNSRPLTPLSDDPLDLNALTPAHFLIGDSLTSYPEPGLLDVPVNRLSRWQYAEQLKQHFWSRWSKDYLTTCQKRTKWKTETRTELEVGQLILLKEDETIPFKWVLARIVGVHPGDDGVIRAVTIRTKKGVYKRPIVKVCPLPIEEEEVSKND